MFLKYRFSVNNFTRANTQVRPYVKYFIVGANLRVCPLGNYLSEHLYEIDSKSPLTPFAKVGTKRQNR